MLVDMGRGREPVWIEEFGREEFLRERLVIRPGQHTTIIAPTGDGKSTLTNQILEHTATEQLPVIRIALKPRDQAMSDAAKANGWRITRTFPPLFLGTGRTWWPKHTGDPDEDDARFAVELLKVLRWCYVNASKGKRKGLIVDLDEAEEAQRLLQSIGKASFLRALYRRMRSNGGGLMSGCQAPKWLLTDAYSQASHLLLGNDPDARNRDRFGEIGGVDPKLIEGAVVQLPRFHKLYVGREDRVLCIVGA